MSKKTCKSSIYDFPELLYDSKLLTNRQRCIILCLFSFLNLKGGGAFNIDIIAKRTRIRKENLYRELKKLPFIEKEGKKISLDVGKLREFLNVKLTSPVSVNMTPKRCQNDTKKVSKRHLESVNLTVPKCQNDTKTSSESQETQKPNGGVKYILRSRSLEENIKENKEGGEKEKNPPAENSEIEILEKKKDKEFIEAKSKGLKEKDERLKEAVSHITNTFKNEYKKHFNKFPLVDRRSQERILESLRLSANSPDELKGITDTIVERIPDFFHLKDDWVKKKGHSFYAFSWRIDSLLSASIPVYATSHKDRKKYEVKEYVPW